MVTADEYRSMIAEERELNRKLRERIHDLTVELAGVQSESRYKDKLIAQKEVQISALWNELRAKESMGRGS